MEFEVTPPVDEEVEQVLRDALAAARAPARTDARPSDAWRRAAIVEAVEGEDYAFSPRSTRGATRA